MSTTKYTEDHEWIEFDGDIAKVGITNYAQEQLGDIVFVELPTIGDDVAQGDEVSVIESVKAAGDVKSPLSGEIIEVNEQLSDTPELVNSDPQGEGWIFKIKLNSSSELDAYLDESSYQEFVESLS